MMRMMEQCWNWMVSLGTAGMLLGILLLAAVVLFIVWLVRRLSQ